MGQIDATEATRQHKRALDRAADRLSGRGGPPDTVGVGQWAAPFSLWSASSFGRQARSPLEVWLSFTPMAPMFGLRWFWMNPQARDHASAPAYFGDPDETPAERATRENAKLSMDGRQLAPKVELKLDATPETAPEVASEPAPETTPEPMPAPERQPELPPAASPAPAASSVAPAAAADVRGLLGALSVAGPSADVNAPATLFVERPAVADDLTQIVGVGPRLQQLLNELGVYTFAQIAAFSPAELRWLDEKLYVLKGRAERDQWVEQARRLAAEP